MVDVLKDGISSLVLVKSIGSDLDIVNAARVSFGKHKTELSEGDIKLIRYLWEHKHTSTFEHNSFTFRVKCPLFVARQWMRHRLACLTGDTEVQFVNAYGEATNKLKYTIEELYQKWHYGQSCPNSAEENSIRNVTELVESGSSIRSACSSVGIGRNTYKRRRQEGNYGYRSAKSRLKKMKLRVLNEDTKRFETSNITDVIYNGIAPVYKVTLGSGHTIKMTMNHKCYTDQGWLPLSAAIEKSAKLTVSGYNIVKSDVIAEDPNIETQWANISGFDRMYEVSNTGQVRTLKNTRGKLLTHPKLKKITKNTQGRSVVSLSKNGKTKVYQVSRLVAESFLPNPNNFPYVCHKDDNAMNNQVSNLYWGDEKSNKEDMARNKGLNYSSVRFSNILSYEYIGDLPVYDLSVEDPWHNFVANGVVVHNSYNEISGRYVQAEPEFYVPEHWRKQHASNRQASTDDTITESNGYNIHELVTKHHEQTYMRYKKLLEVGVAREQARSLLPLATYTEFYFTCNLRALLHFIELRSHEGAQWEIRQYAEAMAELIKPSFPETFKIVFGGEGEQ